MRAILISILKPDALRPEADHERREVVQDMVECGRPERERQLSPGLTTHIPVGGEQRMATRKGTRLRPEASIGVRYGRLIVTEILRENGKTYAKCICDCGGSALRLIGGLRQGSTRTCGCARHYAHVVHGNARVGKTTTEYRIWKAMRSRCETPTCPAYSNYGGRGIVVCERWGVFANFLADMGRRPSLQHSLDRINNDGPYSPDNCRWATKVQQGRNSRKNRLITFNNETLPISEWTERVGFHAWTIGQRLREGWSIERAITTAERRGSR